MFNLLLFLILSSICLEDCQQSQREVTTMLLAHPWPSLNKEALFCSQDTRIFHCRPDSAPLSPLSHFSQ